MSGEEWNNITASLATASGVKDLDRFRRVLAHGLAHTSTYATGGGLARTADGAQRPVTVEDHEAAGRIAHLVAELGWELSRAQWPMAHIPVADDLRRALEAYANHVEATQWKTKAGRATKRPKSAEAFLTIALASQWHSLTGEPPKAWRDNVTGRPGGRFYESITDICRAFDLKPPSPDTVRAVLKHIDLSGQKVAQ